MSRRTYKYQSKHNRLNRHDRQGMSSLFTGMFSQPLQQHAPPQVNVFDNHMQSMLEQLIMGYPDRMLQNQSNLQTQGAEEEEKEYVICPSCHSALGFADLDAHKCITGDYNCEICGQNFFDEGIYSDHLIAHTFGDSVERRAGLEANQQQHLSRDQIRTLDAFKEAEDLVIEAVQKIAQVEEDEESSEEEIDAQELIRQAQNQENLTDEQAILLVAQCENKLHDHPLKKGLFSKFAVIQYLPAQSQTGSENELQVCPFCLDKIQPSFKVITLPCSHILHYECAKDWFSRQNFCPIDRLRVRSKHLRQ